ncbi:plasmid replication protein RepB [Colwellia sp. 39_35_sub15_T18]|nr:plasmid replication protein RepB [Colwellia sp. 39_35_sub15_T18]
MELNQLKSVFESGGLLSIVVAPLPLGKGYMLIIKDKVKKNHVMTTQRADSHQPREFKSIDAAIANAAKIGFREMAVDLKLA